MSRHRLPTLADRYRDPRHVMRELDDQVIRRASERAERLILDDAAARLAVTLSHQQPREIRRMLDQIEFPTHPLWVEFSSSVMLRERLAQVPTGLDPELVAARDPLARTAMLIKPGEDNPREMHSWCLEDAAPDAVEEIGEIMIWPAGLMLYPEKKPEAADKGQSMLWGYEPEIDVSPLVGRAAYIVTGSKVQMLGDGGLLNVARELAGWSRLTVAVMAMLQTVTLKGPPTREPGHVRLNGRLQPHLSVSRLSLSVPHRIRNVVPYVRRRLAEDHAARKRLHEVREHYRHLDHQPRAPGWAPVVIEGQTFWRKRIAGHLRGDPSLGVVEHDATIVHGPRSQNV